MKNLPRIYLDMDGVLFDFVKNIEKTTGLTIINGLNLVEKSVGIQSSQTKSFGLTDLG